MWWAYLLCAFMGGVVALAALAIALVVSSRGTGLMSISFGGDAPKECDHVRLVDSEIRPGGVYVRYENFGDQPLGSVGFLVKLYESGDRLIAEETAFTNEVVAAGSTAESILETHRLEPAWLHAPGARVDVKLQHGWLS